MVFVRCRIGVVVVFDVFTFATTFGAPLDANVPVAATVSTTSYLFFILQIPVCGLLFLLFRFGYDLVLVYNGCCAGAPFILSW